MDPNVDKKVYKEAIEQWKKGVESGELNSLAMEKAKEYISHYSQFLDWRRPLVLPRVDPFVHAKNLDHRIQAYIPYES